MTTGIGFSGSEMPEDFSRDEAWEGCRIKVPPDQISYVSSIFEAYDNQFLVRTENKEVGLIVIWYSRENRVVLEEVILDMQQEFAVNIISYSHGMTGLDEVYPE